MKKLTYLFAMLFMFAAMVSCNKDMTSDSELAELKKAKLAVPAVTFLVHLFLMILTVPLPVLMVLFFKLSPEQIMAETDPVQKLQQPSPNPIFLLW